MTERFSLSGRNAIVTGGTRGIGLSIARGFLESGARVTLCSRKQQSVDGALSSLAEFADSVQGMTAHVGRREDLERLISRAEDSFGAVGILVNNAGTNPYYGPIIDSEEAAWDKTMEVNLKGPYLLSKLVARKMVAAGGGAIINIASVAGQTAFPLQGIYSITKSGLIMLTKGMARELGRHGVRVNCICPGPVRTKMNDLRMEYDADRLGRDFSEHEKVQTPIGGRLEPEDIAPMASYLAGEEARMVTGQACNIDGGINMA